MTTHLSQPHRSLVSPLIGLGIALSGVGLLVGCSGSATGATTPTAVTTGSTPSTAPATKVALGKKVVLPSDTFQVSRFLGTAAPGARKPDAPGTHWASFEVKQCAVTDSRMGSWKVALTDGSFASEPTSWPQELPQVLLPYDETLPPGTCLGGRVYVAMPDGATASAVVLEPKESNPARAEVQWVIGRTSAAS